MIFFPVENVMITFLNKFVHRCIGNVGPFRIPIFQIIFSNALNWIFTRTIYKCVENKACKMPFDVTEFLEGDFFNKRVENKACCEVLYDVMWSCWMRNRGFPLSHCSIQGGTYWTMQWYILNTFVHKCGDWRSLYIPIFQLIFRNVSINVWKTRLVWFTFLSTAPICFIHMPAFLYTHQFLLCASWSFVDILRFNSSSDYTVLLGQNATMKNNYQMKGKKLPQIRNAVTRL